MGGRGSSGRGKGSRTIKPIFRKNTADAAERLFNQQSQEVRRLQELQRGKPIAVAYAKKQKDFVKAMQVGREYDAKIKEQKKKISDLNSQIEDAAKKRKRQ